jgi:uncharacterized protein (TIGR02270 family)
MWCGNTQRRLRASTALVQRFSAFLTCISETSAVSMSDLLPTSTVCLSRGNADGASARRRSRQRRPVQYLRRRYVRLKTGNSTDSMDVDPGIVSGRRLQDPGSHARARSFRAAGEVGLNNLESACTAAVNDQDPDCRFWGARSGVLLGDRNRAIEELAHTGTTDSPHRPRAFKLALQGMTLGAAHAFLKELAADPRQLRWLIQGCGIAGDPTYVPWLINHMQHDETARLAGEAFSLITGADLWALHLERPQPENFESGPNDNPDDPNVAMDADDNLPWPDPERVEKWRTANTGHLLKGVRYFMGAPVTREHCIDVLKNGYQRQRILAAHYLCLLEPGTPLFNTSAPAWRQQRLLAKMG